MAGEVNVEDHAAAEPELKVLGHQRARRPSCTESTSVDTGFYTAEGTEARSRAAGLTQQRAAEQEA
jgi:hypothetical protein